MARIVIDPITRIEGHLRIDVEVDGGYVKNAWSSGQMWRGIEKILLGRDPRDAWLFTQRFCGVCTTVHAIASVRAVENALEARDPDERAVHPQPDRGRARAARPHRPLLPPLGARLGRRRLGAQGRPGEGLGARREPVALAAQRTRGDPGHEGQAGGLRRGRAARHLRQRLLGPPGDEAPARGEPARGAPLPRRRSSTSARPTRSSRSSAARRRTSRTSRSAASPTPSTSTTRRRSTWSKLYMVKSLLDEVVAFVQQVYLPDVCAIGAHVRRVAGLRRRA